MATWKRKGPKKGVNSSVGMCVNAAIRLVLGSKVKCVTLLRFQGQNV